MGTRGVTRGWEPYVLGLLAWAAAFLMALKLGAVSDADYDLILQIRVPRAVLAGAVGMGLAVAGAALQSLFANPLCEPYTLGISSGSALGAALGSTLGLGWIFTGIALPAVAGALVFALILYLISRRPGIGNLSLLLAGVMLGFMGSSLVALWMALADINGIQGAIFWLLGDLSRARLRGSILVFVSCLFLVFALWRSSRDLDALLMGEEGAATLGVDVASARKRLIGVTSLLVGLCVSASGMIGFIGLIIPHFARRMVGSLHYRLIPLTAIWGAAALTIADGVARSIVTPYELPVGAITALLGAPLFLIVMLGRQREVAQ
jgi:iron complex transport system permease protein